MTTPAHLRRTALLAQIAADLELVRAEEGLKRCYVAYGRLSMPTVLKVLRGGDCKISTLVEIADAMNRDVEIRILKRSA